MQNPDLNKSKDDVQNNFFTSGPSDTQLTGCIHCAMLGNLENPAVIYHHSGSTYCLDHLMGLGGPQ